MTLLVTASNFPLNKRKVSKDGFVLLEVLVSMAVLAVGIMAVLTAVLSVLDLQKNSAQRYRAGLILQDRLGAIVFGQYNGEPLRGLSDDGLFSWTVAGEPWTGAPHMQNKEEPDAEGVLDNLFQVSVDVSWQTNHGKRSINASQLVQISPQEEGSN